MENQIVFLFGLAGAGKSYLAQMIADNYSFFLYEADEDLTPAMKKAIQDKQSFTEEMRDEYYSIVADRILALSKIHTKVVVSQGLFKNKHRRYLMNKIPGINFIWVKAEQEKLIERLNARGNEITPEYAKKIALNFEDPDFKVHEIINNSEPSNQVKNILGSLNLN